MKKKILKPRPRKKLAALPAGVVLTYKAPELLLRYVTEQGSILPRETTGLSQKLQRRLAREIKRARHLALMPFTQTV
jgi:ribosomal protein S18